jgi:hypothetical protein
VKKLRRRAALSASSSARGNHTTRRISAKASLGELESDFSIVGAREASREEAARRRDKMAAAAGAKSRDNRLRDAVKYFTGPSSAAGGLDRRATAAQP